MATLRISKRLKHRIVPYQFAVAVSVALAFSFAAVATSVAANPEAPRLEVPGGDSENERLQEPAHHLR
ncbi:MAG TPA: hypothetical protein VFB75_06935 [Burkholderiales bacterium]|nr:hypothetical protein [Burkholderiales bacterium]